MALRAKLYIILAAGQKLYFILAAGQKLYYILAEGQKLYLIILAAGQNYILFWPQACQKLYNTLAAGQKSFLRLKKLGGGGVRGYPCAPLWFCYGIVTEIDVFVTERYGVYAVTLRNVHVTQSVTLHGICSA